ncbi:UNVERIFIED_CONTAM: hypothetical protein NCL1_56654 [Trichonephila clavipes]
MGKPTQHMWQQEQNVDASIMGYGSAKSLYGFKDSVSRIAGITSRKFPEVNLSGDGLMLDLPDVAGNSLRSFSEIIFSISSILNCLGDREPPDSQFKM